MVSTLIEGPSRCARAKSRRGPQLRCRRWWRWTLAGRPTRVASLVAVWRERRQSLDSSPGRRRRPGAPRRPRRGCSPERRLEPPAGPQRAHRSPLRAAGPPARESRERPYSVDPDGQLQHPALCSGPQSAARPRDALPGQPGARFRLPASVNLEALHLPRPTLMMARAAQRYGLIVRDRSLGVGFFAQDPGGRSNPLRRPRRALRRPVPGADHATVPWRKLKLLKMSLCTDQSRICRQR